MDNRLKVVHGYKRDTAIRDYVRSDRFLNYVAKIGHNIVSKNFTDAGASIFQINLPKIKLFDKSQKLDYHKSKDYVCHKCLNRT